MGINKRKQKRHRDFFMVGRGMLFSCSEWKELSAAAKILYLYIKGKFNGCNNGEIRLHYSELRHVRGISSSSTISKANRLLEEKGWITITKRGGLYRHYNLYALTGKYDQHFTELDHRGMAKYKKPSDYGAPIIDTTI